MSVPNADDSRDRATDEEVNEGASGSPEETGTSPTQVSSSVSPSIPEVISGKNPGIWGTPLLSALGHPASVRRVTTEIALHVLEEIQRKNAEIVRLDADYRNTSALLSNERVEHARIQERAKYANTAPSLVFGPIVVALGIAVYQAGQSVVGAALVGIGMALTFFGLRPWWS
jgi:hypothetical protein